MTDPIFGKTKAKKGEVILRGLGYGFDERIVFKYYVNWRWAKGVSLTWPGVWQHFDVMKCRRSDG